MEFKRFNNIFNKKKGETKVEETVDNREAPIPASAQQLEAGFNLWLGTLTKSTNIREGLEKIKVIMKGMREDNETDLLNKSLEKLTSSCKDLEISAESNPNPEIKEASVLFKQYLSEINDSIK